MNKKLLIIILVIAILLGGAAYYWFFVKSADEETSGSHSTSNDNVWNPYSTEDHHSVTLTDQLLSAGEGNYVVKMNITLDFYDHDSYYKFKGYKDLKEAEESESGEGHGSSTEETATPMELKINDVIGSLMMKANDEQLTDRKMLKSYLKDGINKEFKFENDLIKEVYIENFLLQ